MLSLDVFVSLASFASLIPSESVLTEKTFTLLIVSCRESTKLLKAEAKRSFVFES